MELATNDYPCVQGPLEAGVVCNVPLQFHSVQLKFKGAMSHFFVYS